MEKDRKAFPLLGEEQKLQKQTQKKRRKLEEDLRRLHWTTLDGLEYFASPYLWACQKRMKEEEHHFSATHLHNDGT